MRRAAIRIVIVGCLLLGAGPLLQSSSFVAQAQEDWKAEFADVCSKTEDPMALTKEEVRTLIDRCDKLKPRIEKLEESAAKVYLKRLQKCRDLFVFVLESKSQAQ
jgi:hypothetical protein